MFLSFNVTGCDGVYNEESKEVHVPDFDVENPMNGQTVFEIISTDTVKDGHSNFVVYF